MLWGLALPPALRAPGRGFSPVLSLHLPCPSSFPPGALKPIADVTFLGLYVLKTCALVTPSTCFQKRAQNLPLAPNLSAPSHIYLGGDLLRKISWAYASLDPAMSPVPVAVCVSSTHDAVTCPCASLLPPSLPRMPLPPGHCYRSSKPQLRSRLLLGALGSPH